MTTLGRLLVAWGVLGAWTVIAGDDLARNGSLSKGKGRQPAFWSKADGITTFWSKDGNPGGCLKLDTSVLQVDKKKFLENPDEFKGPSKGGQYQTVGAHEGVWAFSWPVEIGPEDRYFIIEVDVNGPAKSTSLFYPQVFVRGYQKFDPRRDEGTSSWFQTPHAAGPAYSEQFGKAQRPAKPGDFLMVYRHSLVCRIAKPGTWEHYQMGVKLPTMKKYRPDVVLLKAYAMWPLGAYYFDNLTFRRATKAEYDAARRKGHSIKGFMPTGDEHPSGKRPKRTRTRTR